MSYILDALKKNNSKDDDKQVPDLNSQHSEVPIFEEDKKSFKYLILVIVLFITAAFVFLINKAYFVQNTQSIPNTNKNEISVGQKLKKNEAQVLDSKVQKSSEEKIESSETLEIAVAPLKIKEAVVSKIKIQPKIKTSAKKTERLSKIKADSKSISSDFDKLPRMTYTTHVYADEVKDRFVMLNGKLYSVGQKFGKNLKVVQINPNDIVLDYNGQRYKVPSLTDIK